MEVKLISCRLVETKHRSENMVAAISVMTPLSKEDFVYSTDRGSIGQIINITAGVYVVDFGDKITTTDEQLLSKIIGTSSEGLPLPLIPSNVLADFATGRRMFQFIQGLTCNRKLIAKSEHVQELAQ